MRNAGIILIIDDDPNDRVLIETAFAAVATRCEMRVLDSAAAAIAYLKGEPPYKDRSLHPYPIFVVTDLKMPGMDGLAVLEHLRANPRAAVIPTVVLSSSSDPDDIEKAYTLGASSYHVKPSNAAALTAQCKLMHDYWMSCEVPEVDLSGVRRVTDSTGRLGERYSRDPFATPAVATPASTVRPRIDLDRGQT